VALRSKLSPRRLPLRAGRAQSGTRPAIVQSRTLSWKGALISKRRRRICRSRLIALYGRARHTRGVTRRQPLGAALNRAPAFLFSYSMPNVALPASRCVANARAGLAQEQTTPECDLGPVPGHAEAPHASTPPAMYVYAAEAEQHTTPAQARCQRSSSALICSSARSREHPVLRKNQQIHLIYCRGFAGGPAGESGSVNVTRPSWSRIECRCAGRVDTDTQARSPLRSNDDRGGASSDRPQTRVAMKASTLYFAWTSNRFGPARARELPDAVERPSSSPSWNVRPVHT